MDSVTITKFANWVERKYGYHIIQTTEGFIFKEDLTTELKKKIIDHYALDSLISK